MIRKIKTSRNKNKKPHRISWGGLLGPQASLRVISCSRPKSPRMVAGGKRIVLTGSATSSVWRWF